VLSPPANDNKDNAEVLFDGVGLVYRGSTRGINVGATNEAIDDDILTVVSDGGVWYTWSLPALTSSAAFTTTLTLSTLQPTAAAVDTVIHVLTDPVQFNDDCPGQAGGRSCLSVAGLSLASPHELYIRVGGFGSTTGDFELAWSMGESDELRVHEPTLWYQPACAESWAVCVSRLARWT
jgi:hypothetical protein